jgi:glycosyltransferase EpsD
MRWFKEQGFQVHVAARGELELPYCDVKYNVQFERSPFRKLNFRAYKELKNIINHNKYDLIHCHTPMGGVLTRLAARSARKNGTRVLYTAHGFHFYKGAPLRNWLFYYPVEKFLTRYTDCIITINSEDFDLVKRKKFNIAGVFKINGIGVNNSKFKCISYDEKVKLRKVMGYKEEDFILIYVAEFIPRKNHKFILDSIPAISKEIPNLKILFAGRGLLLEHMKKYSQEIHVDKFVDFLGFRKDIENIMALSDIGISASRQEGLGLNLAEEMFCSLPVVATIDRGHNEIVEDGKNGFLFEQNNHIQFNHYIIQLYKNKETRINLGITAINSVQKFILQNSLNAMAQIYNEFIYKKDKIILVNQVAGYMMIDIANAFAGKYNECMLLTGELRKRQRELDPHIKTFNLIKYNPGSKLSKFITWVIGFFQALLYIMIKGRRAELFITTIPPLGVFIPFFCSNKYSILIYDVYPDIVIEYNIIAAKSFLSKIWIKTNRMIFLNADRIFTISEGMKMRISKYIDPDKIEIVPCWTDNYFLKPVPKEDNIFIKEQKVTGKFLVIYSGNLGFTHDIEVLVKLAVRVKRDNVFFFIIGEGNKKKIIAEEINKSGQKNIRLLSWQDVKIFPFSLSAADLGVVTLGKEASIMSVPSKLYDIMSVGSPLLSIAEEDSEMAKIVSKYDMGMSCSADQLDKMLDFIYELMDNKEYYQKLRANSLKASLDFTPDNANKFIT